MEKENYYFKAAVKIELLDSTKEKSKFVTEQYIVKAVNPTDAEAKLTDYLKGETFTINSISKTKIITVLD